MKYFFWVTLVVSIGCGGKESASGDSYFEAGKFKEAIIAYTSYLETNPDHIKSLYNRGRSYEELSKIDQAMEDFEAIIDLDANNVNAYLSIAQLSYNQGEFNKVLIHTDQAIGISADNRKAHFLNARALHQLGYLDEALESYNNAITLDDSYGEAFLYRGAVKVGKKQMKSACQDFKYAQTLGVKGAEEALRNYCK